MFVAKYVIVFDQQDLAACRNAPVNVKLGVVNVELLEVFVDLETLRFCECEGLREIVVVEEVQPWRVIEDDAHWVRKKLVSPFRKHEEMHASQLERDYVIVSD